MQIKFPLLECDEELDGIADSIDCKIFVPQDTLQKFTFQLRKIKSSLDKDDHHTPYEIIMKKRKLVEKLSARCEKLRQRNIVISYAERAEEIANMSPFLTDDEIDEKAIELADCIHRFVQTTRPSKNNMKFLRFALKLLERAKLHQPVIIHSPSHEKKVKLQQSNPDEVSLEEFALAESLYELSEILYDGNIEKFTSTLEKNFSEGTKKELIFHIKNCGGDLKSLLSKKERKVAIQGILGFAHSITDYYINSSPYPEIQEIDTLFTFDCNQ